MKVNMQMRLGEEGDFEVIGKPENTRNISADLTDGKITR